MERNQPHSSSGKYKLKPYYNTIKHPPRWLKFKSLIILSIAEDAKTLEHRITAVENVN